MNKPRLKVQLSESGKVLREEIFQEFPVTFGRSAECQLHIKGTSFVSRLHGSISIDRDQIVVSDLGSLNGINYQGKPTRSFRAPRSIDFKVQSLDFKIELEGEEESNAELTDIRVFRANAETIVVDEIELKAREQVFRPREPEKKTKIPDKIPDKIPLEDSLDPGDEDFEKSGFSIAPIPGIENVPGEQLVVQGVITWYDEIYDVRNYLSGDRLLLGPHQTEPIYLPIAQKSIDFGLFQKRGAVIRIPNGPVWRLYREKIPVSNEILTSENRLFSDGSSFSIQPLGANEVLSIDMGAGMTLHFRYVKAPQFTMARTLIENREEFRKAIIASLVFHLGFSLIALLSVPKSHAPVVENVSPRIVKLIIEPPPQIMAPPPTTTTIPPVPPPTTTTEAPPPPAKVKPPPEKKKPPPPKVKAKPQPRPEKPVTKPEPPPKQPPKVDAAPPPPKTSAPPPPPQPTEAEKQQAELAKMLSSLPAPPSGGSKTKGAPIQIAKDQVAPQGLKVAGVVAAAGSAQTQPHGTADTGFAVGSAGYSKQASSGKTGKRAVGGAVVGVPDFTPDVSQVQGLNNAEVMTEVNKHLAAIQRCYERALFDDATLIGRVEYEWEIGPSGSVNSARVERSEMARGDGLNNCVLALIQKMKFPKAKNGQPTIAKIGFPFGKN